MDKFRHVVWLIFAKEYSLIIGRDKIIHFYTQWLRKSKDERDSLLKIKNELVSCRKTITYLNQQTYTGSSSTQSFLFSSGIKWDISGELTEIY